MHCCSSSCSRPGKATGAVWVLSDPFVTIWEPVRNRFGPFRINLVHFKAFWTILDHSQTVSPFGIVQAAFWAFVSVCSHWELFNPVWNHLRPFWHYSGGPPAPPAGPFGGIRVLLGSLWGRRDHFGPFRTFFWPFWPVLNHFVLFLPFRPVVDHFGPFLTISACFGPFLTLLDHFGPVWTISAHFCPFLTISAHFWTVPSS